MHESTLPVVVNIFPFGQLVHVPSIPEHAKHPFPSVQFLHELPLTYIFIGHCVHALMLTLHTVHGVLHVEHPVPLIHDVTGQLVHVPSICEQFKHPPPSVQF